MRLLLTSTLVFAFLSLNAQDRKEADKRYEYGDYEGAYELYEELVDTDSSDLEANYRCGVCLLNSNIDKSKAIPYFERIKSHPEVNENILYLLARAYQYGYRFDEAIETFSEFIKSGKGSEFNRNMVTKQLEYCDNAKEYMKFPLNVDIENLGKNINSSYPDYFPFIPENESYLVYNSRRDVGELLPNGKYTSDIYISHVKNGEFQPSKRMDEKINSEWDEEVVGLAADGSKAILYIENINGTGDLHMCRVVDGKFDKPYELNKMINSKYTEIAASVSSDGKTVYFASDKPGGYGGTDIYVSRILPNGKWGPSQNLGPTVNTEFDEDFPNLSPDGKTLFFSSKGHASMGGYDIFKAIWDPEKLKYGSVQNMRFPINTPDDDMNFMISKSGRYGYMSSLRSDGHGDLDIYRVTFNEVEPKFTVITGTVLGNDGKPVDPNEVYLAVVDQQTNEIYGDYRPNLNNNRFVIILPPGQFEINLEVAGYEFYVEQLNIEGKSSYKSFIQKDITLKK